MTKIVKNTTASDIELNAVGVTIPASGQYVITVQEYLFWASDDSITEVTPFINSGDLVINDGIQDLPASDGIEFLEYPDRGKVHITENDTTVGYLKDKLVAGAGVAIAEQNNGANETLLISSTSADPFANALFDDCTPLFDKDAQCNVELLEECG